MAKSAQVRTTNPCPKNRARFMKVVLGETAMCEVPRPRESVSELLKAAETGELPEVQPIRE